MLVFWTNEAKYNHNPRVLEYCLRNDRYEHDSNRQKLVCKI